jgi:NADH:ubiquinone oxidoreductase subunit F (NADH-binding)
MEHAEHLRWWGRVPTPGADALIEIAELAGVVGAGGAGFPTARKLASLAGRRVAMVIVNGAEGESASGKDGVLLEHVPHLVLDGAVAAARALGAARVVVRVSADRPDLTRTIPRALAHRDDGLPIDVSVGPATFVSGEASAVIRSLTGGPALPADLGRPPTTPSRIPGRRSGVLLSNVETFARLAVASHGVVAQSALVSASGAVGTPGVLELPTEGTLADVARLAGGLVGHPSVLITGGWHGRWVPWDDSAEGTHLTRAAVAGLGGRWGAGAFVWVPGDVDPWDALAAVAAELAEGTAGQCGPCWRGLPEVASAIRRAASGRQASRRVARVDLDELLAQVDGRGICAHPTAAVAALRSAMDLLGGVR